MKASVLAIVLMVVLSCGVAHAYGNKGVVTQINDDLTVSVRGADGATQKISLYGIYVPKNNYQEVKTYLEKNLVGETIYYFSKGEDFYRKATFSHVLKQGSSVQYELLNGHLASGNSYCSCPLCVRFQEISPDNVLVSSME